MPARNWRAFFVVSTIPVSSFTQGRDKLNVKLLVLFALLVSNLSVAAQPEVNRTDSCVNDYAAEVDYFPQKVEVRQRGEILGRVL